MRKTELFAQILKTVANETELTPEQILSCCRTAETVDARYMLVYLLKREGIYIGEIARMMNFSRRGVEKMLSQLEINECSAPLFALVIAKIMEVM